MSVLENLKIIQRKIAKAKQKVVIVGVSKLQPNEVVREGIETAKILDLGENYVQELLKKQEQFANEKLRWHLIGPLQTNKVKLIIGRVHLVHTLDRESLAQVLCKAALEKKVVQDVLIQVNISGEETKSGVSTVVAKSLGRVVKNMGALNLKGLMIMPPATSSPEESRPYFRSLRELMIEMNEELDLKMDCLSMGTSQDYDVAVEEGATHIRVGSVLFGDRK